MTLEQAWSRYRAEIEDVRLLVLGQPWAADAAVRLRAYHLLEEVQAAAYNLVIAPRTDFPAFYLHTAFEPIIYTYALHAADFLYRRVFLDGRRTYRIWGHRRSSAFVDFQVINVFYGVDGASKVGNWDLDAFEIAADGSFEIILDADPRPGNWIRLDRTTSDQNYLNVREIFNDWSNEQGVELHIERIGDDPLAALELTEGQYIDRVDRAGRFFRFIIDEWSVKLSSNIIDAVGYNAMYDKSFAKDQAAANNPAAIYPTAMWRIEPDEALILESDVPQAQYWGVQLGDHWWHVLDFTYHQTSLNGMQARLDSDGRFRAVIAHTDPGIANWLDTIGNQAGVVIFRFYRFDRPVLPSVRKVKFADVRSNLPADTPSTSCEARAESLRARRVAARARYRQ